ncbi:VRR-NUC domain-containing protein [Granulosicoccus sp. 3-233]|uniref:VRR-NUC domain-containing protein n=1 Tax=Granulosicoccus sp. 3-233 TaxID=3417969 RepID=UPI003D352578
MLSGETGTISDDYYLANFHRLAEFVVDTYRDILTPEERQWYASVQSSPESAQRLYIRLLTRKGSVFRLSRLRYPEIDDLQQAAGQLATRGLADISAPTDPRTLLAAFTKPELLDLLEPGLARSRPRAELIEQVMSSDVLSMQNAIDELQGADHWITLFGHQHWNVFRLGFFGNLYQDSSEFVLQELGTVRYESYRLDNDARAYATRAQLNAHLRYFECEALFETIDQKQPEQLLALIGQLPVEVVDDDHLQRRVDRYRNRVARQLERLGRDADALALYAHSLHPPARERRIRLHLQRDERESAARLLASLLEDPFNDAESQVGERLQQQLNKLRGRKSKRAPRFRPQTTTLTLSDSPGRVELAARDFYARFGECQYTENALSNAVLGLFIWDIIFHPVPGAFFNPFQSAPADFRQPSFARRRANLLMSRFEELDTPDLFRQRVVDAHAQHQGKSNPLVRWGRIDRDLLVLALDRIPADHWRVIFQRILSDTRENTSGFPDLILFREEGGYEFIEIKGPGDTLQQNQLRWMQYFDQSRIPCRVVNVRWAQQPDRTAGS